MSNDASALQALLTKIQSAWQLLRVDQMIAEMHGAEAEMQRPDFWADQENAKLVGQRHEDLRQEVETWQNLKRETEELLSLVQDLQAQPDEAMKEEVRKSADLVEQKFQRLEFYILLDGKHDKKNAIVAVHAGSGGTEAQDWAEMLRRMIFRYCEKKGWVVAMIDESRGAEAGIKSSLFRVEGRYAYGHLQSEHGTHRLVRISPFDAEQMRHTSFALIEVIPEIETHEETALNPKDLRIDTFMSGGKGGQSVNTTYSAVRVVHLPTGITVQCQNERSQLQNKATALKILQSKLQKLKEEEEEAARQTLRGEYKSAEWGNQIRSYVLHPYKLVKDVRTRFETADPEAALNGELDPFVEAYLRWKKQKNTATARGRGPAQGGKSTKTRKH